MNKSLKNNVSRLNELVVFISNQSMCDQNVLSTIKFVCCLHIALLCMRKILATICQVVTVRWRNKQTRVNDV